MDRKKVLLLFGGPSMEYYAACKAVGNLVDHIEADKFDVTQIGITQEGKWYLTKATSEEIKDGDSWAAREDNIPAFLLPERDANSILVLNEDKTYSTLPIDVIFSLVVGYGGEDGKLQGLFDLSNIPYVGSGLLASAVGMDKEITRIFADLCGLKQPECVIITKDEYTPDMDPEKLVPFGYPAFVKPANGGTSVGVSKVENESQLRDAMDESFKYDDKTLIEQEISGSEVKVAVLGNDKLEFGSLCKITTESGIFNNYEAKQIGQTTKEIPAQFDESLTQEILRQTEAIYHTMGCAGFARVDFFLNEDNEIYFNEINTVPGLGKSSIFSIMFEDAGLDYSSMLTKLINTAFEK